MSVCKTCHKDSEKHSKELWKLHQEQQNCMLCRKNSSEHSEKLWEIHQIAIKIATKGQKLHPLTLGTGRESVGRFHRWNTPSKSFEYEVIPIFTYCTKCTLAMGDIEVDNADVLDGLCIPCFCEEIGQEYDSPFGECFTGVSKGLDLARDWRPS